MRSLIKAPWTLDEERFVAAPVFMPRPPTRREMLQKDEELILRGSPTSTIGRVLKAMTFSGRRPTGKQITEVIDGLLLAASHYGLTTPVVSPVGATDGGLFRRRSLLVSRRGEDCIEGFAAQATESRCGFRIAAADREDLLLRLLYLPAGPFPALTGI
jgi:hypothetical protein